MLHIMLLILKIIGIILAAILGILVLLVCIVLFVPVRYEVTLKCDGTLESLKGKVTITWFLHLLRADIIYKNSQMKKRIRIAWKSIADGSKSTENKKNTSGKKGAEPNEKKSDEKVSEVLEEQKEAVKENETIQRTEKTSETQKRETGSQTCESQCEESKENLEEAKANFDQEKQRSFKNDLEQDSSEHEKSESISQKIKDKVNSLKKAMKNFCKKIKELNEKKEKISEFLQNEVHIAAFQKLKKELFFLLKKWKPQKSKIRVRYGFDDPCTTGQVLAGLSVVYPFLGDDLVIEPDFENKIFKGYLYFKGKIRVLHLIGSVLRLLISKNIRATYKHIKGFKI